MQPNSREKNTLCRTCLQQINNFSQCHSLKNQESNDDSITVRYKLSQCIPELHLDAVPATMICNDCFIAVNFIYDFKNKCLQTEKKINTYLGETFSSTGFVEFILGEQVQQTPLVIVHSGLLNENSQPVATKTDNPSLHSQNVNNNITDTQIQQKAQYPEESDLQRQRNEVQVQERSIEIIEVDSSDNESEMTDDVIFVKGTNECNITSAPSEPSTSQILNHVVTNQKNSKQFNGEHFSSGSSPQHRCIMCSSTFTTKAGLTDHLVHFYIAQTNKPISQHQENLHNGNSSDGNNYYKCVICDKDVLSQHNFISHIKSHAPKQIRKCDSCNYSTCYRRKLKRHKISHESEPTHKCPYCDAGYWEQTPLNEHVSQKHRYRYV